jgi:hypothetical protein
MEIPARLNPAKDQYQAADERLLINELRFNRLRTGEPEGGRAWVFIHLPLIRREEEWRDVAGRGVRRQGDR